MAHTYRVRLTWRPRPTGVTEDPETYWLSLEEVTQLLDDVLTHYENRVDGSQLKELVITPFGPQSGLQREQLWVDTGY